MSKASWEIERKFRVRRMPEHWEQSPCLALEQAYLCTAPVVRVRRENQTFYLTYKGAGKLAREEYNLPLTQDAYEHLRAKADGAVIAKKRWRIPVGPYTAEVDVFEGLLEGQVLAEVEFPSRGEALAFVPPDWMGEDVTLDSRFANSFLSGLESREEAKVFLVSAGIL